MSKLIDLTGQRFGRLVAVAHIPETYPTKWLCRCICGNEKVVRACHLRTGATRSCGCLLDEARRWNMRKAPGESSFRHLVNAYRARSRRLEIPWKLTDEKARALFEGCCIYCGAEPSQVKTTTTPYSTPFVYNGIDRLDNDKGYVDGNVVTACGTCNKAKRIASVEEFLSWIKTVYEHLHLDDLDDAVPEKQADKLEVLQGKAVFTDVR